MNKTNKKKGILKPSKQDNSKGNIKTTNKYNGKKKTYLKKKPVKSKKKVSFSNNKKITMPKKTTESKKKPSKIKFISNKIKSTLSKITRKTKKTKSTTRTKSSNGVNNHSQKR